MSQAATKPNLAPIDGTINRETSNKLAVSQQMGGVQFSNMGEVLDFAKLLAVSFQAVPPHCRNQPGICLGITIQAIEWRMSPYAVASKSYVVNDRLSYESQLIHAVIEQRAPINGRLRHRFEGEGQKRRCIVWATARGESEPLIYTSPEFAAIQPKNSPLWKTKPDLQLFYNASRDWARMYFPDVILGVYADDELPAIDVGAGAPANLPAAASRVEHLRNRLTHQTEQEPIEPEVVNEEPLPADEPPTEPEPPETNTATAEEAPPEEGTPPMPDYLKAYLDALHLAKTPQEARAAWETHIETRSELTDEEFNAATEVRNLRMDQLEKATEGKKGRKKKELFDGDSPSE